MFVKLPFCFACLLISAVWFMTQRVSGYAISFDYENDDCGTDYGTDYEMETRGFPRFKEFPEDEESYDESVESNSPEDFYYLKDPDIRESVSKKAVTRDVEYPVYVDELGPPPLPSGDQPPTWVFEDNDMC